MRTLGIILARSGSKGVKDKNIRQLGGRPLIAYTIESALRSHHVDTVMVSTDSALYADISKEFGADVPFLRSRENSTDDAQSMDVIFEVLHEYEKSGSCFENLIVLQPTSPMRTAENIDGAFELFYEKNADSVVSVCECEFSPLLSNILPENLNLYEFIQRENLDRRQNLRKYYRLNGAVYISKVDVLKEIHSFYGKNPYAYIMDQRHSVDIDTELDFEYAEFLLKRQIET